MHPPPNQPTRALRQTLDAPRSLPPGRQPGSLIEAHADALPEGPILFLGAWRPGEAVQLARQGRVICVVDDCPHRLSTLVVAADEAGVDIEMLEADADHWRLGYQHWAGIVALAGEWPEPARRRIFGQIPNALKPRGLFLMEARALGPEGPEGLDDQRLDPEEIRPELEMLDLIRFATCSRPVVTPGGGVEHAWLLEIVGIHAAPDFS